MSFDIELRVRINEELERQAEVLKERLNEPSNASLVRRLIQDRFKDLEQDAPPSRDAREELTSSEVEQST